MIEDFFFEINLLNRTNLIRKVFLFKIIDRSTQDICTASLVCIHFFSLPVVLIKVRWGRLKILCNLKQTFNKLKISSVIQVEKRRLRLTKWININWQKRVLVFNFLTHQFPYLSQWVPIQTHLQASFFQELTQI